MNNRQRLIYNRYKNIILSEDTECSDPIRMGACCFIDAQSCIDNTNGSYPEDLCSPYGGIFYANKQCSDPEVDCFQTTPTPTPSETPTPLP